MNDEAKPAWLRSILESAAEGTVNVDYIRQWVAENKSMLDKQRGLQQPLTKEDNAEIERLLDEDRRGPMV